MGIVGPIQFWRSCKIVFVERRRDFSLFFFSFFTSPFLLLSLQLEAAPAPTSPPSPFSHPKKNWIFDRSQTRGGGVSRLVVIALRFFFLLHAPNLFVYFEKVPKHILFTRLTQYITCLQKYQTMYRRFVKSCPTVSLCFLVTISNVFYKIFFKPYSTTISLIKQSLHKKT